MYEIHFSKRFRKDHKKLLRSGSYDDAVLMFIIQELSEGRKLNQKYRDHDLTGNMVGYRECHLSSDLLLVYKIVESIKRVALTRIGSHSEALRLQ